MCFPTVPRNSHFYKNTTQPSKEIKNRCTTTGTALEQLISLEAAERLALTKSSLAERKVITLSHAYKTGLKALPGETLNANSLIRCEIQEDRERDISLLKFTKTLLRLKWAYKEDAPLPKHSPTLSSPLFSVSERQSPSSTPAQTHPDSVQISPSSSHHHPTSSTTPLPSSQRQAPAFFWPLCEWIEQGSHALASWKTALTRPAFQGICERTILVQIALTSSSFEHYQEQITSLQLPTSTKNHLLNYSMVNPNIVYDSWQASMTLRLPSAPQEVLESIKQTVIKHLQHIFTSPCFQPSRRGALL